MRVLLTGANGHLGATTAKALLHHEHEVVAFVRPSSDLRGLEGVDVEYAHGDITDRDSVVAAAKGCDAIVHTAAIYKWWAKDSAAITTTALQGAVNVFEAARQANVKRLIYTSSTMAIGTKSSPNELLTAADWHDNAHTTYSRAKTLSERRAWELAESYGIPMISLCPGAIFGPNDYRITPSTEIILGMADGSGQTFDSGFAVVDVRDAAHLHARAVDLPTTGKRYVVAGANITFVELAGLVTEFTGKKVKHFGASPAIARVVGALMEFGAHITGKEPAITRALVEENARRYQYVDASATKADFGWEPIALRDTVRDTLDWLVQIGKLDAALIKNKA